MSDIFKGPATTTIPKQDSRIVRVGFDKSDIGARKSHMPKSIKNDNSIKHVS